MNDPPILPGHINILVGKRTFPGTPARQLVKRTWKTKDGRDFLISEMSDDHLQNTIRYLEARGVCTDKERLDDPVAQTELVMTGHSVLTQIKYEMLLEERELREKVSASDHAKPGARRTRAT